MLEPLLVNWRYLQERHCFPEPSICPRVMMKTLDKLLATTKLY
nr:MAG TPA: hypothetical protein [Caudoviricetes sp.]